MNRLFSTVLLVLFALPAIRVEACEKGDRLEANKRIVRAYSEAMDQPDFTDWGTFFSEEVIFNGEHIPPEALPAILAVFRKSFPDLEFTQLGQIAEGNHVATWGFFEGTHAGEFNGIAPTDKRVRWFGVGVDRIEGGKVVELGHEMDLWGLMRQLKAPQAE